MSTLTAGGWNDLRYDLWRRTVSPARHATYVAFFIGSVVGLGGLGIWFEWINYARATAPTDMNALRTAVATFFPALVGSTCFQIILGKYLKSLRAISVVATLLIGALGVWLIMDHSLPVGRAISLGTIATLFSFWFWWIANADNPDLQDEALPEAAVGGDANAPLAGNLDGFNT